MEGGRHFNPRENGRTASNGIPGGNPRMNRSAYRAYKFTDNQSSWADSKEYVPPTSKPSRGPTKRSQNWKNKKQASVNPLQAKSEPVPDLRAVKESAPSDEPLYDIGPHTTGTAVNELYSQNFEFSGFVDIVERSYNSLRAVDPRLDRRMPYSGYLHSMCNVANAAIFDMTTENGERRLEMSGMVQDYLLHDQIVPTEVYEYLTGISNITTPQGEEIKFNLPEAAIPRQAIPAQHGREALRSGSFGHIVPGNHNVYECYLSPLITALRVEASRDNVQNWAPLTQGNFPHGCIPNQNLLGFGPIDTNNEGRQRLQGVTFQENGILGRFKISQELLSRVNVVLMELKDRHKMTHIGIDPSTKIRNYIKRKPAPANLLYVESHTSNQVRLSLDNARIHSCTAFGSSQAGHMNINASHRRRIQNHYGHCYLQQNGNAPVNWNINANNNFMMINPFQPQIGIDEPLLRISKFVSMESAGSRIASLDQYIRKNYMRDKN